VPTRLVADLRGAASDPHRKLPYVFAVSEPSKSTAEARAEAAAETAPGDALAPAPAAFGSSRSTGEVPVTVRLAWLDPALAAEVLGSEVSLAPLVPGEPGPRPELQVMLLVETDPAGADVSLDETHLGKTPLRIRLDPRVDHLLQVEREGCEARVQLLEAQEWKAGRSPKVVQRLDCR
jgi:hypothetical protein